MLHAVSGVETSWERQLKLLLKEEADLIKSIMQDGPERYIGKPAARALMKYGVVEPRYPSTMSGEEFLEATREGTLLVELERRLSLRERC